ncbi:MAG: GDSL-type esterase/lipase family protein [Pirellulaceae bacterium]|jgi:lysophospholipase L1-like esterase|nr:GDSL-type esterase/lipase family protein [Pirellulaceae bacterium]MDP6556331.1 GDSL-type esterase/lipase family protein [Pirellulaceae bacterium]MDP6720922.1 GDSL-type esterase/lipase family protein [Pirellulaceae bacterium]
MIRLIACLFMAATTLVPHLVSGQSTAPSQPAISDENIHLRGVFQNARIRFEQEKTGHVAFIGGSITEMNGYRPLVMELLQRRFPKTAFTFTAAGISSTCSTTGAFRLQDHVLDHGTVDLFFVEFAVNDDQDAGHAYREALRGMEGVVRHTRQHNPRADIVITYFVNPGMLQKWQANETPTSVRAHEQVAEHYHVPAINLARQVAQSISSGDLTWALFGGTHPKPLGNRIAARMIDRLMTIAWDVEDRDKVEAHPLPQPIDPNSYFRGRFINVGSATISGNAVLEVPNWKAIGGGFRGRFGDRKLLCLDGAEGEIELKFTGTAVGTYVLAGPDAAKVVASVDGSPPKAIDLYHRFSKGLHYPRTVMFATELTPGDHTLTLRVDKSTPSDRQSVRILKFVAN